ncbi:MAG: hypothetical protein L6N95_01780 [Candidatus Methylarchaceae archaeon HK01B]|nr:hypothetical protein [Candidatus Methylarchaceae archaeon HK01M]MCP8312266.1 hypothetical protein [Candidatus Methylarchaceae archaeon HK02M1]MCP8318542.1 hypothetical protein [Candidatus Methylarchaceae archaeon HK01B]
MAKTYYDLDVDLEVYREKSIAEMGYGNQGCAQATNMKDSGFDIILGLRVGGASRNE